MPLFGASGGGGAVAVAPATGPVLWREHVRRHGHWILGFFSGLFFGLGASVLLWQYNVWLLNIVTAIVVPVVVGILVALVAWRGRSYSITATARDDAPPPPASVAAEPQSPAAAVDGDADEEPPPPAARVDGVDDDDDDEPPPPAAAT
jgi:hypothetical protein